MPESESFSFHRGFLRLPQVLTLIPVSKATWWKRVALGEYPAGIKLSAQITVWRVADIQKLLQKIESQAGRVGGAA